MSKKEHKAQKGQDNPGPATPPESESEDSIQVLDIVEAGNDINGHPSSALFAFIAYFDGNNKRYINFSFQKALLDEILKKYHERQKEYQERQKAVIPELVMKMGLGLLKQVIDHRNKELEELAKVRSSKDASSSEEGSVAAPTITEEETDLISKIVELDELYRQLDPSTRQVDVRSVPLDVESALSPNYSSDEESEERAKELEGLGEMLKQFKMEVQQENEKKEKEKKEKEVSSEEEASSDSAKTTVKKPTQVKQSQAQAPAPVKGLMYLFYELINEVHKIAPKSAQELEDVLEDQLQDNGEPTAIEKLAMFFQEVPEPRQVIASSSSSALEGADSKAEEGSVMIPDPQYLLPLSVEERSPALKDYVKDQSVNKVTAIYDPEKTLSNQPGAPKLKDLIKSVFTKDHQKSLAAEKALEKRIQNPRQPINL